jgi:hypothetical protein
MAGVGFGWATTVGAGVFGGDEGFAVSGLDEGTETTEGTKGGFAAGAPGVEVGSDFASGVAAEDAEDTERGFEGGADWGATGMMHFAVGSDVAAGVEVLE